MKWGELPPSHLVLYRAIHIKSPVKIRIYGWGKNKFYKKRGRENENGYWNSRSF